MNHLAEMDSEQFMNHCLLPVLSHLLVALHTLALFPWKIHIAGCSSMYQAEALCLPRDDRFTMEYWASSSGLEMCVAGCSATYQAEAVQALETKRLQALCVTWNVNERFPEAGCPLFAWLRNTSATCNLAVIGLQEVEMGSGSVAMGTVKDNLFRGLQVGISGVGILHLVCIDLAAQ